MMTATEERWKEEVREKLVDMFIDTPEDLYRIFFYLDQEDKAYKNNLDRPYAPHWKSLKVVLKRDEAFRDFAIRLSEKTRKAEINQDYQNKVNKFREEIVTYCDDTSAMKEFQEIRADELCTFDVNSVRMHRMKIVLRSNIIAMAITAVDDVLSFVDEPTRSFVMKCLTAVYLFWWFYININRWWRDEISWKRCAKKVLVTTTTVMAGMAGGVGGASLEILRIPGSLGAILGGIVGGLVTAAGVAVVSDYFSQKLFGIPQDEALENAYRCLGVKLSASNAEIREAFRRLCLKHYPDKEGKKKDLLRSNMATIILARKKNDALKCDRVSLK